MAELNGKHGEWKTINGAPVFIEDGQSVEDALSKLNDKPKREKRYMINRGTYKLVIKESEIGKYKDDWYYQTFGDDIFEELHLDDKLDFIENMDYSKSIPALERELRTEITTLPQEIKNYLFRDMYQHIEDYQQSLADDILRNVPKAQNDMLEESVMSINKSNYDTSKSISDTHSPEYAAYTYNCQRCAQAFILRWCHGYDVTAKPSHRIWNDKTKKFDLAGPDIELDRYAMQNDYDKGSFNVGESNYNGWHAVIFNRGDVQKTLMNGDDIANSVGYSGTEDQLRWIKRTVKESGPGAAYLCSVCWKGTRREDGTYNAHVFCIINDGGKVKFVDPQTGEECSRYFTDKQIVPKKTEIFRADNCKLNGTMMKEVIDYEGNSK